MRATSLCASADPAGRAMQAQEAAAAPLSEQVVLEAIAAAVREKASKMMLKVASHPHKTSITAIVGLGFPAFHNTAVCGSGVGRTMVLTSSGTAIMG